MTYLKNKEINWEILNYSMIKLGGFDHFLRNNEIVYNIQKNNDNSKIFREININLKILIENIQNWKH